MANSCKTSDERRTHLEEAEGIAKTTQEWLRLAAAYRVLLDDSAKVVRCLELGRAKALTIAELLVIAEGYAKEARDATAAIALLNDAEERQAVSRDKEGANNTWHWKEIASVYLSALNDPIQARRCLDRGLALATNLNEYITIARAWAAWKGQHHAEIEECFNAAEESIETLEDLLDLAEAFHKLGFDRLRIRCCLDHAYYLSRQNLRRIARGFRDWFDEAETADRIIPPDLPPSAFVTKVRALPGWSSDATGLITWLCGQIDLPSLKSIAKADYGCGVEENLAALTRICETGLIPEPLGIGLTEVLGLTRWGGDHLERAFASALLCLQAANPTADWGDGVEQTIAVLIESCIALGSGAIAALEGFLVALVEGHCWEDTPVLPFATFGLLLTAARRDASDPRLPALVDRIVALELEYHKVQGYVEPQHGWLLGITCFDLCHEIWRALAKDILDTQGSPPHLRGLFDRIKLV